MALNRSPVLCAQVIYFYIPNIKALTLVVSDKKFFHVFPRVGLCKPCDPGRANFVPHGQNFNILGRGQLGDVT